MKSDFWRGRRLFVYRKRQKECLRSKYGFLLIFLIYLFILIMEISGIQDYSPGLKFYKMIIKAAAAVRSCYIKHQT